MFIVPYVYDEEEWSDEVVWNWALSVDVRGYRLKPEAQQRRAVRQLVPRFMIMWKTISTEGSRWYKKSADGSRVGRGERLGEQERSNIVVYKIYMLVHNIYSADMYREVVLWTVQKCVVCPTRTQRYYFWSNTLWCKFRNWEGFKSIWAPHSRGQVKVWIVGSRHFEGTVLPSV